MKVYLFDNHTQVMCSVLYSCARQTAAQQFDSIFDGVRVFDNPESFQDMSQIVEYLSGPEDMTLDFFAGSCSTYGVIHANKSRGSRRRFLCVQLPEPVNKNTNTGKNAAAAGLDSIAEIGKDSPNPPRHQADDKGSRRRASST